MLQENYLIFGRETKKKNKTLDVDTYQAKWVKGKKESNKKKKKNKIVTMMTMTAKKQVFLFHILLSL